MPERRFTLQVGGRQAAGDLAGLDPAPGRISSSTVLRAHVRDQSDLHGLLRRVHDLGLHLVDLHEAPDLDATHGDGRGDGRDVEITVEGPVGELVEATLSDCFGRIQVSSRYSFDDATLMGAVLTRLLDRGADLELAGGPRWPEPGQRRLW